MKWGLCPGLMGKLNRLNNLRISHINLRLLGQHMVIIIMNLVVILRHARIQIQRMRLFILVNNIHHQLVGCMFTQTKH